MREVGAAAETNNYETGNHSIRLYLTSHKENSKKCPQKEHMWVVEDAKSSHLAY